VTTAVVANCKSFPCDVTADGHAWTASKVDLSTRGLRFYVPFMQRTFVDATGDGHVLEVSTDPVPANEGSGKGGLTIPAKGHEFTLVGADDVPCVERGRCGARVLLHGNELVSSSYSICYEAQLRQ